MNAQSVTLRILGDGKGLSATVDKSRKDVESLGDSTVKVGRAAAPALDSTRKRFQEVGAAATSVRSQVLGIVSALGGIQAARQLIVMADQASNLRAQIRLATDSETSYAAARQKTFEISQRTSTELASTIQLYSRLTRSTDDLGISQDRILRLTETINQTFAISGTSAVNQANAITQLTQAFAGGVLRAEEFNSIIENSSRLSDALAAGLGISTGELRRQVNEGLVDVGRIIAALEGQAGAIGSEFAQIAVNTERAWTQTVNAALHYVDESEAIKDANQLIADSLVLLADHIGTVAALAQVLALLPVGYVASATAAAVQAASQRQVAATALAEAEAQVVKMRAMQALTPNVVALTAAESRLAAAQAAATAAGVGRAGMLARLGQSLMSLAGGPVGVAVLAVGALGLGLKALSDAEREREATWREGLANSAKQVDDLLGRVRELNAEIARTGGVRVGGLGEALGAVIAQETLLATKREELRAKTDALRIAEEAFAAASMESGADMQSSSLEIADKAERVSRLQEEVEAASAAVDALSNSSIAMSGSLREATPAIDDGARAVGAIASALSDRGIIAGFSALVSNMDALKTAAGQVANDTALDARLKILGQQADEARKKIDEHTRSTETWRKEQQAAALVEAARRDSTGALVKELEARFKAENAVFNQLKNLGSAEKAAEQAARDAASEREREARAAEDFVQRLRDQVSTYGMTESAKRRVELASLKLSDAQRKEGEALLDTLEALEAVNPEMERLTAVYAAAAAASEALLGGNVDLEEQIAQNADKLAGLTDEQIAFNAAQRETNKLLAEAMALGPMTAEQYAAIEARLQNLRTLYDQSAAIQSMEELGRVSEESARRGTDAWDQFTGSLAQAVIEGGGGVKRWWKQLIDDMKRQLLQSGLLKIFGSIFNTRGATAGGSLLGTLFAGGAAAGTPGTGLGAILGGASQGGGLLNGILGSITGGLGGLSAGISSGVTGILSGIFGGAGTTSVINPITGSAIFGGGGFAGTLGAIAGPAAIAAGVAMLVNTISNGRLFGTSYKPNGSTAQLNFGETISGTQSVEEVRQRSLFRGRQWRTTTTALGSDALDPLRELQERLRSLSADIGTQFGTDAAALVSGSFKQTFDKDGKLVSEISTVLGRTFRESAEEFQQRLTAEQIFAGLSIAMQNSLAKIVSADIGEGGGFGGGGRGPGAGTGPVAAAQDEIQRIAERWRNDAGTLLEGANFLLLAVGALKGGDGLLGLNGTLTETTDLVERLNRGEESLSDTFTRLLASTNLLEEASRLSGVQIAGTRVEFVELATDIVDALGGLDRASALWQNFFETFYDIEERGLQALEAANAAREQALQNVGLDAGASNDEFRAAAEAAFASGNADTIANFLEAAAAIRAAADAQAAYNDALAQAEQPMRDYEAAVRELAEAVLDGSLTDYQREIRAINAARTEEVARLNDLARAAGMQGAAEEDLALIHTIAARKAAEALAKLRSYASGLVQQFNGGSQLDLLNEQIAAIESSSSSMYQSQVDGLGAVDDAARSTYEAQIAAQQRIREFLDNLMLGPLGGLRPRDQLAEGQRQFDALLERALGGDAEAMAALPQLADQLLRIGQQVFASGDPYFSLRDSIMAALEQVAALPATAPNGLPGGSGGGSVEVEASAELQALYEERDRLLAEQTAAERLALAQDISAAIRDLVMATGFPLETIATDLNLNMADLVTALGINLENMTAANANALGDVAASMGVNLAELAANVGVDLGSLADRQSLLNDALESQIDELPQAQRDQLAPLLRAVEDAAALGDTAGVEDGVSALETAVNALAPNLRDQLAPYFEGVVPVDYTQLDALSFIDAQTASAATTLTAHTDILNRIADNLRESNLGAGLPAYATGTMYVPRTGPALIHEGEMILPAPVARFLRQPQGGGSTSSAVVEALRTELRGLREQNAKLMQLIAGKLDGVKTSVETGADKQAKSIDRQTEVIKARK